MVNDKISLCYNSPMDFSRPDNARTINTLKVLNALRTKDMSRAELSRELNINKVSISEITESLRKEGIVEDGEKDNTTQGRPSQKLTLSRKKGRVFSFFLSPHTITASASNLKGGVLRFERFPKDENYLEMISSFLKKMTSDNPLVYGVTLIGAGENEIPDSFFPWPVIRSSSAVSEARAELEEEKNAKTLYVSWGSRVEGVYYESFLHYIPTLGHMKVTKGIPCSCGMDGCLEAAVSTLRLKEVTGLSQVRALLSTDGGLTAIKNVLSLLVFAVMEASQATGAKRVVITGELSGAPDEIYSLINEKLHSVLPPNRRDVTVYRAKKGERGALEGAGIIALDEFFYHPDVLDKLNEIEKTL